MKKCLYAVIALLFAAACQEYELVQESVSGDNDIFAVIEPVKTTKTSMDDCNDVLWSEGDEVIAFLKSTLGDKYQIKEQYVGSSSAGFSKVNDSEDDLDPGEAIDHNVVLYPYSSEVWCVNDDVDSPENAYKLNVILPEVQNYATNSFGNGAFPMIAVSTSKQLSFRNICGGLKLQFKGVDKIKSIKLEGLGNEKISGKSTVVGYVDGSAPTITMAANDNSFTHVILDCGEGVQLSETDPTTFIIAVPPVEFASGMKITVTDTDGLIRTLINYSANTIKRSCLTTFPVVTYRPSEFEEIDLSESGAANSYIVSLPGSYKFSTVKGNSHESVGKVASAEVLWESFGTNTTPNVGDLIKDVVYSDGYISFLTADYFKEGNAVIAAKDTYGDILWSWHIWLTDEPKGQEYYNNAGAMMDRNLGATSATPGDVGALGLLYQWGRKDPFLGSSSISSNIVAESTLKWPSEVSSTSYTGTISYAIANPTTFITYNDEISDWYYYEDFTDNTRWTTLEDNKSIYDPCPAGWRIPDGVWSKALGSTWSFEAIYDSANKGMDFSDKFGSDLTIWYPASGGRSNSGDGLFNVGNYGYYWSASPGSHFAGTSNLAYTLQFHYGSHAYPSETYTRAIALSVRCVSERASSSDPSEQAVNLSQSGSANSYIVSSAGSYKFSTVKGNSHESVGAVASAEVLWESFGTNMTPNVGDLIKDVVYSDGYISFLTADYFKEGNAVIAAKDASDNILWSWHIWLTDEPKGQVYYNNAGTMMDRNLGATSATPGAVGALGLLYQWGRKDPFLASSSIHYDYMAEAKSTITWPSVIESDSNNGTIEHATAHPTAFIKANSKNSDWYYTGSSSTENTRWTESDKDKSMYDPCPPGWRVPDGGDNGFWSKALGSAETYKERGIYDDTDEGVNFSGKFGSSSTIWYPASGCRYFSSGALISVGKTGGYWSASYGYCLHFDYDDFFYSYVSPSYKYNSANGYSVRCVSE